MMIHVETKTLSLREVAVMFGVTTMTIRAWTRAGKFPRPLKVSGHKYLWNRELIEKLLREQQTQQELLGRK